MYDSLYSSNSIDQAVTRQGQGIETNSPVFTTDVITAPELAIKYKKIVTALVDGKYVGWSYPPDFIRFKNNRESQAKISEITYWGDFKREEFCRFHCMLLVAFGGYSVESVSSPRLNRDENSTYFTQVRGRNLPKSKRQEVIFRHLFDQSGYYLDEYGIPRNS
jgi:hypothetical protein